MKKYLSLFFIFCAFIINAQNEQSALLMKELGKVLGFSEVFTAEVQIVVGATSEAAMRMNSTMYVGKNAVRTEMELPGGLANLTSLIIFDGENAQPKAYMLSPEQKVYSELPAKLPAKIGRSKEELSYKIIEAGEEIIDGKKCLKKELQDSNGKIINIWLLQEGNVPLRVSMREKGVLVMLNFISFTADKVDEALLKIPEDYQKGSALGSLLNLAK